MLYNKNKVSKINDKKILHKVGKKWIVMSVAVLGLLGGGALATSGSAHHVAMPNMGVVAHADQANNYSFSGYDAKNANDNNRTNGGTINAPTTINAPQGTAIKNVYNAGNNGESNQINDDAANYNDGVSAKLNDDKAQSNTNNNYVIRLGKRISNTVNFMANNKLVTSRTYTGAQGYTHKFASTEAPNGYQFVDATPKFSFGADGATQNVNVREAQWEARINFNGNSNVDSSKLGSDPVLAVYYTGDNPSGPQNLNISSDVLDNLAANDLAIDVGNTTLESKNNLVGNNPISDQNGDILVDNQAKLRNLLKGYQLNNSTMNFDDTDGRIDDNPANMKQDYDAKITFVNTNPGNSFDQDNQVGPSELVDFGQNDPSYNDEMHEDRYYTIDDAVKNGVINLPDGYQLATRPNGGPTGGNNLFKGDAMDTTITRSISNTNIPNDTVYITHKQSTHTKNWHAAIQYVDEFGNKIGNVHPVDTGILVNYANSTDGTGDGEPDNLPNINVGEPATVDTPASGLFAKTGLTIPNGYVVDTADDLDSQSNFATASSNSSTGTKSQRLNFEPYSNPAVTYVQLDPAYEANITLKDAVTGQIVNNSKGQATTPVTFLNTYESSTDNGIILNSKLVSDYNGTNNMLNIPDGYKLADNRRDVAGLISSDKLPVNDPTNSDNSTTTINRNYAYGQVPNDVVLVSQSNPSTDYAAIQFKVNGGKKLGNPIVVNTNSVYNYGHDSANPYETANVDNGPDLGAFLAAHPGLIPAGYQLTADNENSQRVNYQMSEHPAITNVYLQAKPSNNGDFETAIQFQDGGQNVGMPVMVDTGTNNRLDFNQNLGDSLYDNTWNSVRLGSFLDAFGIQAPAGYHFALTNGTNSGDDQLVNLDRAQGADGNNITDVAIAPNDPSTSNYVANDSNAPVGPNNPNTPNNPNKPNTPPNPSKLAKLANLFKAFMNLVHSGVFNN